MTKIKDRKKLKEVNELFQWCLDQAMARRHGTLSQEKIKKLDSIGFRWKYYEEYADGVMAIYEEYKNKEEKNIDEDKKFLLRDKMFWNHMDTVHYYDPSECCTTHERHECGLDDKCCREVLDKAYREAGIK